MDPRLADAVRVALGFSWPLVLNFAGKVTTFQVFLGTGISGILYFAFKAWFGHTEVGTFTIWPMFVIAVCGVMSAYGCDKYIPLLTHPKYVGIALALTQVIVVYGNSAIYYLQGGRITLTPVNLLGGLVTAFGVFLLNLK